MAVEGTSSGGDERYGCPGLVWFEGEAQECGLVAGHRGDCTLLVGPLPPPILHPLDAWLVGRRFRAVGVACPDGHGARGRWHESSIYGGRILWTEPSFTVEPATTFRHFVDGAWSAPELEALWRFEPCGCVFREILTGAC